MGGGGRGEEDCICAEERWISCINYKLFQSPPSDGEISKAGDKHIVYVLDIVMNHETFDRAEPVFVNV